MQIKNKKNTRKQQEKTEEPYKVPPCILVRPIAKKLVPALLGCAVPAALIVAEVLALLNGVDFTEGAIEIWTLPVMLLLFWVIGVVIRDVTVPAIQKSTKNIEYLKGIIYWLMKAMKEVKTRTNYSTANYDLKYALRYFVRDDSDTDLIRRIVHDMSSKDSVYFDKLINDDLMDYKEIARHLAAPIAAGHLGLHRDDGKSILDYFDDEELLSYVNKLKEKHAGR